WTKDKRWSLKSSTAPAARRRPTSRSFCKTPERAVLRASRAQEHTRAKERRQPVGALDFSQDACTQSVFASFMVSVMHFHGFHFVPVNDKNGIRRAQANCTRLEIEFRVAEVDFETVASVRADHNFAPPIKF